MSPLVLCLLLQAAAAPQSSVEGVVLNAVTKEPVRKAEVQFAGTRTGGTGGYSVVTDAQGQFAAGGMEPGDYSVTATRTGYLPGRLGAKGNGPGTTLRITAGQSTRSIEILLTPQAVIAGRVVDDEGDPMQFVQVGVMQPRMVRGRRQPMRAMSASTNDKGEFRIANLAPGKYLLAAEAVVRNQPLEPPGGAKGPETGFAITFFPGVADPAQSAPIEVQAGQELTGLEIMLRKTPVYRVRGRVIDGVTGQPSERSYVFLVPRDERGGMAGMARQWGASRMVQGAFEITGVPAGSYMLVAQRHDQNERTSATVPLDIGGANIEGLTVALQSGMALPGRLVVDGTAARSLKDVRVTLNPTEGYGIAPAPNPEVKEDGSFTLRNVLPGRYRVNAWGDGLRDLYVAAVRHNDQDVTFQDLDVAGGAAGTLTVVLRGDGGSVGGSVREGDQPAPGGSVLVVPAEEERRNGSTVRVASITGNGSFGLKNLRPGEYLAIALPTADGGTWDDPEWMKARQSEMTKVTVSPNGSANVQLVMAAPDSR